MSEPRTLVVNLIISVGQDERFLVWMGPTGPLCPRIVLRPNPLDGSGLGPRIEKATLETVGVTVTFNGLLSAHVFPSPRDVYALVSTNAPMIPIPGAARLTLAELDDSGADPALVRIFQQAVAQQFKDTASGAIQRALAKSVEYLSETFAVESGQRGWSQYLEHDTVGILSSAQGLLALTHANATSNKYIEGTAECLEEAQNNDGGWRVKHGLVPWQSDISITESTCYCIWALRAAGRSVDSFTVSSGAGWLMETQRESGGWGASERTKEANVLSTAFAVRVLAELGYRQKTAIGVQWLRSTQCIDGGWGFRSTTRPTESSPAPTAHAVISLLAAGAQPDDPAIVDACAYLRARFTPYGDEPWQSAICETLVDPDSGSRLVFRNYATPWALIALIRAGAGLSDLCVQQGVDRLLDQQGDDGSWRCHVTFPSMRTMWAAHDAMYALQTVASTGLDPSTPTDQTYQAAVLHALKSWLD